MRFYVWSFTKKSAPRPIKTVFNTRTCLLPECRRTGSGADPHDRGMAWIPDLTYMSYGVDLELTRLCRSPHVLRKPTASADPDSGGSGHGG